MLSAISDAVAAVGDLLGTFGAFVKYGLFGIVVCSAAYFIGSAISSFFGRLAGFAAAALIGLVLIGGANALDFYKDAQALRAEEQVRQLKEANRLKEAKLAELRATNAKLQAFLDQERQVAEDNATTIEKLNAMIDATDDNPDCTLSEDFVNELEKLR